MKIKPVDIVLDIKDLVVGFEKPKHKVIIHNVSLSIGKNKIIAIVGESGSGKSLIAKAIIGLLNEVPDSFVKGKIQFYNELSDFDILSSNNQQLEKLRGKSISMIFQDPYSSFNPLVKCGKQIDEIAKLHLDLKDGKNNSFIPNLLIDLNIDNRLLDSYPHQLSGGQLQRLGVALALASDPSILIADEPTTNLDSSLKKDILDLLLKIKKKKDITILYISHDLDAVRYFADEIVLLRDGQIIERSSKIDFFSNTKSSYGKQLTGSNRYFQRFDDHKSIINDDIILEVKALTINYNKNSFLYFLKKDKKILALDNISFLINKGETLGIIGESGSGKTTLAKAIVGLIAFGEGKILFDKKNNLKLERSKLSDLRKNIQIVFQNPISSLNPAISVKSLLIEAIKLDDTIESFRIDKRIKQLLEFVGLDDNLLSLTSNQISGGEGQRVAIARALAVNPRILILDESISSLDRIAQVDILKLLISLKEKLGLTFLFITHDLFVAKYFCDNIIILKDGKIIESNSTKNIFQNPSQEYTKMLLNSMLVSVE